MVSWKYVSLFLSALSRFIVVSKLHHYKMTEINETNIYAHLNKTHISSICSTRDEICQPNGISVCTMRLEKSSMVFKDFASSCYLFLSNTCDQPGEEYHIIQSGSCRNLNSRKFYQRHFSNVNRTLMVNDNSTGPGNDTKTVKRSSEKTTIAPLYGVDTAFDDHVCPYSCPDEYSPICLLINMGSGKYFKYFTFVNHCYGDLYYCKNYKDLGPPPGEDYEDVKSSPLGWSYCGAYRYMQFARFSEVLSAMGHYGWLAGDYRYSHIMEPKQRMPGFG